MKHIEKQETVVDHSLAGKHVVITGGTGALGRVVVTRLIEAGAICHVPGHRATMHAATGERAHLHIVPHVDLAREASVDGFY